VINIDGVVAAWLNALESLQILGETIRYVTKRRNIFAHNFAGIMPEVVIYKYIK
jgi:hypothetical protein